MKGIVNLPAVTPAAMLRPALRRSRKAAPVLSAKPILTLTSVAIAPVSFRDSEQTAATTRMAARGYSLLDGDAPDITGRAVNILI